MRMANYDYLQSSNFRNGSRRRRCFYESNAMPEIAVLPTMIDLRNRIEFSNDSAIFDRAFRFNVVNYKI